MSIVPVHYLILAFLCKARKKNRRGFFKVEKFRRFISLFAPYNNKFSSPIGKENRASLKEIRVLLYGSGKGLDIFLGSFSRIFRVGFKLRKLSIFDF